MNYTDTVRASSFFVISTVDKVSSDFALPVFVKKKKDVY